MTFSIDNPRGVATTPLRKICLGKTLRRTRVKFQGNCVILSKILPELVSFVYEWISFCRKIGYIYMGLLPNFQWHICTKTKFEYPPPRLLYNKFYCSAHAKHTVFVLLSLDERQLRVFVELAMNSAGEEAFELDKVTCFHRAVTGYAAFIFELKEDAGYKDLLEVSKKVWNALDNDKHLSKELVRCGYTVVVVIWCSFWLLFVVVFACWY